MKELVEYIATALVDNPAEVSVKQSRDFGNKVNLELQVAKEDMGRIIGKSGRVANSIRVLLRVAAARDNKQVNLDVVEGR
ncbi:MAG TPA: KH domain-containing protein [Anaerolineaceae bacterium]|jgi:hypothetical protein|nr:KH domain-containing protein [Anaerolineaceae bacterium]HPC05095.1 KH domain-containing protein [Anaerolineaceae bacterium]HQN04902.1 KH domain-containing protein [Anaerolineaceae bacterium]HQP07757.1 KH domain-containing protein [Anaerolineaceae bacterium]